MGIGVLILFAVICRTGFTQVPPHGSLRLGGIGSTATQGRVEIYYNNAWGTICSRYFSTREAIVVCRQLGMDENNIENSIPITDTRFGQGTDLAIIEDINCFGNENSVLQCQIAICRNQTCTHRTDVGVICVPHPPMPNPPTTQAPWFPPPTGAVPNPPTTQVGNGYTYNYGKCHNSQSSIIRLVQTKDICFDSGVVQIKINGAWVVVCDDLFERVDARVICGYLCYERSQSLAGSEHFNVDMIREPMLITNMTCTGHEASPLQCTYSYGSNTCSRNEMAMVSCAQLSVTLTIQPPDLVCRDNMIVANFTSAWEGFVAHSSLSVVWQSGSACFANRQDYGSYMTFTIPFDQCGTIRTWNSTHIIYKNAILYVPNPTGLITRVKTYIIFVQCEMNRIYYVEKPFVPANVTAIVAAPGNYTVIMTFFIDNFITAITQYPVKIPVGDWLNVQLTLITSETNLVLIVKTCFATPSSNRFDLVRYELFTNKVIIDETVCFFPIDWVTWGFRFQTFKFIQYNEVHIHCEAYVCPREDTSQECDRSSVQQGNQGHQGQIGKRKRRDVERKMIYITSKAIMMYDPVEEQEDLNNINNMNPTKPTFAGNFSTPGPTRFTTSLTDESVLVASNEITSKDENKQTGNKHHGTKDPSSTTKAVHVKYTTKAATDEDVQLNDGDKSHASNTQEEVEQNFDDNIVQPTKQVSDQAGLVHDTVEKVTKEMLVTATASIKELTDKELAELLKSTKPTSKATTKESTLDVVHESNATFEKLVLVRNSGTKMKCPMFTLVIVLVLSFAGML